MITTVAESISFRNTHEVKMTGTNYLNKFVIS